MANVGLLRSPGSCHTVIFTIQQNFNQTLKSYRIILKLNLKLFCNIHLKTPVLDRSNQRRCSIKKIVSKNLQYSQKNTCARASFSIKLKA